jgi:hypothetical protein
MTTLHSLIQRSGSSCESHETTFPSRELTIQVCVSVEKSCRKRCPFHRTPNPSFALRLPPPDDPPITGPSEHVVLEYEHRSTASHHSPLFRQGTHPSPSCTAGIGPPSSDLYLPSLLSFLSRPRERGGRYALKSIFSLGYKILRSLSRYAGSRGSSR